MNVTLGGGTITNGAPWEGKWTPIDRIDNGDVKVTVRSTTAVVVRLHAVGMKNGRP